MSYRSLHSAILLGTLAAIASGLPAAAKVISIDQGSAAAGNVTPGDSPGFPVTISLSGSYRLTGNLTVPDANTTAIQITADSVTLDLNGFSITGPVKCATSSGTCDSHGTGIGVQAGSLQTPAPHGVRILNGSVHGMGLIGIQMAGVASLVERVTVYSNAGGGMTVAGSVIQSAAAQNGSFGIIANTVRDSASRENFGDGIILNADGGLAIGNVSSSNGGYGISAPFSTVTGNSIFLNKSNGISAICPSTIAENTIIAGDVGGMQLQGTGCVLLNNATRP